MTLLGRSMLSGTLSVVATVVAKAGADFHHWGFMVLGCLASILFALLSAVILAEHLRRER